MSQIPFEIPSVNELPEQIQGYVSVRPSSGRSFLSVKKVPTSPKAYYGKGEYFVDARRAIESSGLNILAESKLGFPVVGPPAAFEELTGGQLVSRELLLQTEGNGRRYVTHIDITGKKQPDSLGCGKVKSTSARIDGVVIESPQILHGVEPSPLPPSLSRYHLRVPDDVAIGLNAPAAHQRGHRGEGVNVAMVDSGQSPHPFFVAHSYDVSPPVAVVPGTSPNGDPVGHGTGESANVFAVAPRATLSPYRASNNAGVLVGALAAFVMARDSGPAVMTNSYGSDGPFPPTSLPNTAFALEILEAVQQGIFVVFSAGNGQFGLSAQLPFVMSAGGVFMERDFDLRASNYSSGYASPFFVNRIVPDSCGLVGLLPSARYILLPLPPGSRIDVSATQPTASGGFTDPGDGTTTSDGWALFSGTSAAAPQLAGVAALILGARPGLTPAQVKQAMNATAIDVRIGRNHPRFNNGAGLGQDQATGFGLVNADAAVQFALNL